MLRFSRLFFALVACLLMLGLSGPAGAGRLFTIDGNSDDFNDGPPTDDLSFSFSASKGTASGTIASVDLSGHSPASLDPFVLSYFDFGSASLTDPDLTALDILIFDIILDSGSSPLDEVRVSVATDPLGLDPVGIGFFDPTLFGLAGATQTPDLLSSSLVSGGGFFPGAAVFDFDKGCTTTGPAMGNPKSCSGNIQSGETTVRLFVAWDDTGPQSPLSKDQSAVFSLSSGINHDFNVDIVPEPNTVVLVGLGLTMLGFAGRRRRR